MRTDGYLYAQERGLSIEFSESRFIKCGNPQRGNPLTKQEKEKEKRKHSCSAQHQSILQPITSLLPRFPQSRNLPTAVSGPAPIISSTISTCSLAAVSASRSVKTSSSYITLTKCPSSVLEISTTSAYGWNMRTSAPFITTQRISSGAGLATAGSNGWKRNRARLPYSLRGICAAA